MHSSIYVLAALAALATARTDLDGCVSSQTIAYGGASVLWYVPDSCEICAALDCGGGRAPPKTTVPGCAAYVGTASYTPSFLASCGAAHATTSASHTMDSAVAATPYVVNPIDTAHMPSATGPASLTSTTTSSDVATTPTIAPSVTVVTPSAGVHTPVKPAVDSPSNVGSPSNSSTNSGANPVPPFYNSGLALNAGMLIQSVMAILAVSFFSL